MDGEEEAELGNPKMIRTTPLKPAAALLRQLVKSRPD
jgi:hypothetical protein